jgi:uncharacterized protein YgbK (DUF1537 family)
MQPHTHETPQPVSPRTAGPIFIVADDLTGACDSAVPFVSSGRTVRVSLDLDRATRATDPFDSVIAFSTETRDMPRKEEAADRVGRLAAILRESKEALLFKKVDSAARGHFEAETVAAVDASGAVLALVAPAFPDAGRTVRAGRLTIRDAAGQCTTIGLRDLFPQVDDARIATLPTGPVEALELGIARAISAGVRILLCDSESQTELEHLALAASRFDEPILWTGSAGLARALAATIPISHAGARVRPGIREGRTLVFIGTDHPVTQLQVSHLKDQPPEPSHTVHVVDWTAVSPQHIRDIFTAASTAALILSGGETAAYVLGALRAKSILLASELAPGIPWGIVEGGEADGCMVVTKSGGFGPPHALANGIHFCSQQGCIRRDNAST